MNKIVPPWTDEQVIALNTFQQADQFHPFTCANRGDGKHIYTSDYGILIATTDGWGCPSCDYTQDWAHAWMAEPLPPSIWAKVDTINEVEDTSGF